MIEFYFLFWFKRFFVKHTIVLLIYNLVEIWNIFDTQKVLINTHLNFNVLVYAKRDIAT